MFCSIRPLTAKDLHRWRNARALIDTHSHLLPWVDHGCPDLETSVAMARAAAASRVHTVVCTPHLPDMDETAIKRAREVVDEVRAAITAAGIDLRLLLGFEVDVVVAATSETAVLESLAIEDSGGAIILETPFHGWPLFMEETIFRLSAAGMRPVLAHPERNDRVQKTPGLLGGCLEAGAVLQATAASASGEFGRDTEKAFFRLLGEGQASLLATDAHAYRTDGWTLTTILERVSGLLPADEVVRLVDENPSRLLSGKGLLGPAPAEGGGGLIRTNRRRTLR
jgi:protein-tyrosine phosphatase